MLPLDEDPMPGEDELPCESAPDDCESERDEPDDVEPDDIEPDDMVWLRAF